jgi:hypothetical protein
MVLRLVSTGALPPAHPLVATDPSTGTSPFRSLRTKANLYFKMDHLSNRVSCNYYLTMTFLIGSRKKRMLLGLVPTDRPPAR